MSTELGVPLIVLPPPERRHKGRIVMGNGIVVHINI